MHGLHDATLSRTPSFSSQDGAFVKVLNCAQSHWVCASNLKCKASSIKVYDSNRSGMCHFQQKTQLCTRSRKLRPSTFSSLVSNGRLITPAVVCMLQHMHTSRIQGKDPTRVACNEANLRSHFLAFEVPCNHVLITIPPGKPQSSKFKTQIYC